jgi:hypothetical protein
MHKRGYVGCICAQDGDAPALFPPEEKQVVREGTLQLLSSPPRQSGVERTRWRLRDLCGRMIEVGVQVFSRNGVRGVLERLGMRYLVSLGQWS